MSLCRHVFTGVLKYAYELLTLDTFMKLPGDLQVRMKFNLLLRDSTLYSPMNESLRIGRLGFGKLRITLLKAALSEVKPI